MKRVAILLILMLLLPNRVAAGPDVERRMVHDGIGVAITIPDGWPAERHANGAISAESPTGALSLSLGGFDGELRRGPIEDPMQMIQAYYDPYVAGWLMQRSEWRGLDLLIAQADHPQLLLLLIWKHPSTGVNGGMVIQEVSPPMTEAELSDLLRLINSLEPVE